MLKKIMSHRDVNCRALGDGLQSVNFADRAFYKARWDDLSIQARGLFVEEVWNTEAGQRLLRVCGRSYRKFFYQDERGVTYMQRSNLPELIRFPMTAYVKENGYLGILFARQSARDGKPYLQPASKSTIKGDFAEMFGRLLQEHMAAHQLSMDNLATVLHESNTSVVFEVIHPTFDPHIIRYKEPHLVLLECINNCVTDFSSVPFEHLRNFADQFKFQLKSLVGTIPDMDAYDKLHQNLTTNENFRVNGELVEGLVLEDTNKFMIKVKSIYYNNWKRIRTLKEVIRRGRPVRINNDEHPTVVNVIRWLQRPENRRLLDKDVITIRSVFLGEVDEATAVASAPVHVHRSDEEEDGDDRNSQLPVLGQDGLCKQQRQYNALVG